jgi:hypothetical protein
VGPEGGAFAAEFLNFPLKNHQLDGCIWMESPTYADDF